MNETLAALRDAPHVSVSAIKSFIICPEKYRHRYIAGTEASHRSIGLVLGSAVHQVLARFYDHLKDGNDDVPVDLLLDAFSDAWRHSMVGEPPVKCDDVGAEKDRGVAMLEAFHAEAPRPLEVLSVEAPFALALRHPESGEVSDRLIVGAIDAVVVDEDNRIVVVEAKTAKRRWSKDQLVYDFQPTIYKMAVAEMGMADNPVLRYDFILKLKKPAFETVEVVREPYQETEARRVFWEILRAVEAGISFPIRSWACNDCEFGHACR